MARGEDAHTGTRPTPVAGPGLEGVHLVVLGGSGLIGSEVVRQALEAGATVTAMARHRTGTPDRPWLDRCRWVVGAVESEPDLGRALDGADWVVDAVGCPPPSLAPTVAHRALERAVPVLTGLLEQLRLRPGVGLSYLSSGGTVYGDAPRLPVAEDHPCDPVSAYGATKLASERCIGHFADRHGIPVRVLRVANAYGPLQTTDDGQGLIAACLDAAQLGRTVTIFGDGGSRRDFVDVADVAGAVLRLPPVGPVPERTVNVGSGTGYEVRQVVAVVARITGRPVEVVHAPARAWDVGAVVLDVSRLRRLVDWAPRSLEEGVAAAWSARRRRVAGAVPA